MGAKTLSSRAIIGEFYARLAINVGASWIPGLSMPFQSDQESETYKWLGQVPAMREWIGGRNAKGFSENGITIENLHFEGTIKVLEKELRRDKTGQVMIRIGDLARRTNSHWAKLLSTLMINGTSGLCYDGQFFYDTDHVEGKNSTSQSNDITTDISGLPAVSHGTPSAPSIEEAQQAIFKSIAQLLTFKDNENEPMNEDATDFLVMVPSGLYIPFSNALLMPRDAGASAQKIPPNFNVALAVNSRFTGTDDFQTFRTDGDVKPFIRQEETDVRLSAKAEGSEYAMDNAAHQYGVDVWRNAGYGVWQHAVYNQLV